MKAINLKYFVLSLGFSVLAVTLINCTNDRFLLHDPDTKKSDPQVNASELPLSPQMNVKIEKSFDGDTQTIGFKIPNSDGDYDLFQMVEPVVNDFAYKRVEVEYIGSTSKKSKKLNKENVGKEGAPELTVTKTNNNVYTELRYYENGMNENFSDYAGDSEIGLTDFYILRYGHDESKINGYYVIVDMDKIAALAEKAGLSKEATRSKVLLYYTDFLREGKGRDDMIFQEWDYISEKVLEKIKAEAK